jgi:hypothetical protein
VRIQGQAVGASPDPGEAEYQRLPQAAHRRKVQTAGRRPRQVIEIDASRHSQQRDGLVEASGASEERGVDAR